MKIEVGSLWLDTKRDLRVVQVEDLEWHLFKPSKVSLVYARPLGEVKVFRVKAPRRLPGRWWTVSAFRARFKPKEASS